MPNNQQNKQCLGEQLASTQLANAHDTHPCRGAVLVIVLIVLSALSLLAVEFSRYAFLDHALSVSTRSVLSSKLLAESAEQFAATILVDHYNKEQKEDTLPLDLQQMDIIWSQFSEEFRVAEFEGQIRDENSRFPLNRIFHSLIADKSRAESAQQILQRILGYLLEQHGYDGGELERQTLVEGLTKSIMQWGGGLAIESEDLLWYLEQDIIRLPPERPFISPQELWILHWPDISEELQSRVLLGNERIPGLLDLITVWSTGPMNINTLEPIVVGALPSDTNTSIDFATAILQARADENTLTNPDWYDKIFEQHGGIVLPIGLIDSRTRVYRLSLNLGVGARKTRLLSIGNVSYTKINWKYRIIQ